MKFSRPLSIGLLTVFFATTVSAQFNPKNKRKKKDQDTEFSATGIGFGPDLSDTKRTSKVQTNGTTTTQYPANLYMPNGGVFVQVAESLQTLEEHGRKSLATIQGSSYKFKVPAKSGGYEEREFKIGVGYRDEGVQEFLSSQGQATLTGPGINSSYSYCAPPQESLYVTQNFQATAAGTVIKGYKVGNHFFAYGGIGAEGGAQYSKEGFGNWIYLGAIAEAGVGVKSGKNTFMVGGRATGGLDSKSPERNAPAFAGIGGLGGSPYGLSGMNAMPKDPQSKGTIGANARFVNDKVAARAGISTSEETRDLNAGTYMGGQAGKVRLTDFACEVLIKVNGGQMAIGAQVSGQTAEGNAAQSFTTTGIGGDGVGYGGGGSSDSRINTSYSEKNISAGFKLIYLLNGPKSKKGATGGNH